MIHIWLDESDKHGVYYSNFYGGILVESRHREIVLQRMEAIKQKANILVIFRILRTRKKLRKEITIML